MSPFTEAEENGLPSEALVGRHVVALLRQGYGGRPSLSFIERRTEGEGFEPPEAFTSPVFKTGALNRTRPPLQNWRSRSSLTLLAGSVIGINRGRRSTGPVVWVRSSQWVFALALVVYTSDPDECCDFFERCSFGA